MFFFLDSNTGVYQSQCTCSVKRITKLWSGHAVQCTACSFSLNERVVVGFRVLVFYFNGFEDFNILIFNKYFNI